MVAVLASVLRRHEIDTVVNEPNSKRENEVQFRVQGRFWGFVLLLQRREAMGLASQ